MPAPQRRISTIWLAQPMQRSKAELSPAPGRTCAALQ